jgi:hypothetical protein
MEAKQAIIKQPGANKTAILATDFKHFHGAKSRSIFKTHFTQHELPTRVSLSLEKDTIGAGVKTGAKTRKKVGNGPIASDAYKVKDWKTTSKTGKGFDQELARASFMSAKQDADALAARAHHDNAMNIEGRYSMAGAESESRRDYTRKNGVWIHVNE